MVALRKESVDRNTLFLLFRPAVGVALRKESVDRNDAMQVVIVIMHAVALRKESVDRNCRNRFCPTCQWRSLSARRAWIEMLVRAAT